MVQTRCTPVFVSSLLPQVSRSNALIAVTIKCLTAMIDHVELRYSTKSYSPSPTLSLHLTTLSSTPMIPLTTTTTTPPTLSAVKREKSEETSKNFCCGVYKLAPDQFFRQRRSSRVERVAMHAWEDGRRRGGGRAREDRDRRIGIRYPYNRRIQCCVVYVRFPVHRPADAGINVLFRKID